MSPQHALIKSRQSLSNTTLSILMLTAKETASLRAKALAVRLLRALCLEVSPETIFPTESLAIIPAKQKPISLEKVELVLIWWPLARGSPFLLVLNLSSRVRNRGNSGRNLGSIIRKQKLSLHDSSQGVRVLAIVDKVVPILPNSPHRAVQDQDSIGHGFCISLKSLQPIVELVSKTISIILGYQETQIHSKPNGPSPFTSEKVCSADSDSFLQIGYSLELVICFLYIFS